MLAKKKTLIFCLLETGGGGGGVAKSPNQNCLQKPRMSGFFFWGENINQKNRSFLRFWRQKGGWAIWTLSWEDKLGAIFFCKHPLGWRYFFSDCIFVKFCKTSTWNFSETYCNLKILKFRNHKRGCWITYRIALRNIQHYQVGWAMVTKIDILWQGDW